MATFGTRSEGGRTTIIDRSTHETIQALVAGPQLFEDFLGQAVDVTNSPWAYLDTGGGAETIVADAPNGHLSLALDATSEAQLAGIYGGDQRTWALNLAPVFEARFKLSVLPTSGTIFCIGLMGDHHATADTVAENIWIRAEGNGVLTAESDDGTTDNNDIATGVTVTNAVWTTVRIDCSSPTDIKFYLNGARVAAGTTFSANATPTLALQPVVRLNKASGTSVGTCLVDYVKIWQQRA